MLASDFFINLAKLVLILNGLHVTGSQVDAPASSTISTAKQHELKILQMNNKKHESVSVGSADFLNIRHERSKQRRHASNEKRLVLQPHVNRHLYEVRPELRQTELQHKANDQKIVVAIKSTEENERNGQQLMNRSKNSHSSENTDNKTGLVVVDVVSVVKNLTSNLNNSNGAENKSSSAGRNRLTNTGNISNIDQATVATHDVTFAALPTAALKAVTHKIRKLHKKELVESLRQFNIDKLHPNASNLIKNHHRSLLKAEHFQQQQQQQFVMKDKDSNTKIAAKSASGSSLKQKGTAKTNGHQMAKKSNGNEADTATNDIEANRSVNDGATPPVDDGKTNDDYDDDDDDDADEDDKKAKQEDSSSLSNIFHQNDHDDDNDDDDSDSNNSNNGTDGEGDGVDDVAEIYATTLNSLMYDDKFVKQFKNFSSQFIKDIDNNVEVDDIEMANQTFLATWQPAKDENLQTLNSSSIIKSYSPPSTKDLYNNLPSNAFTQVPYDVATAFHDQSQELFPSASSRADLSLFYEKEEINFNDSFDLIQDDAAAGKDLLMDDEALGDNSDDGQNNDFPLSELDEPDSETETATEGISEAERDDDTNHFLEGAVDAANSEEVYDWDEISRSNRRDLMHGRDVVTKFLQIVETQHSLGSNCEAGTSLNLGEGVVDRYAQDRFRIEAEVAVNRANMLTRIFKMTSASAQADINLLHASVLSMVEFDDDIFAAGNCFDWNEHPSQPGLFCPFAYRLPPPNLGAVLAKDLAMEYHYLGNTSEWFFQARKNAEKVIARNEQYLKAFHLYSNSTEDRIEDDTLAVKYEDGRWSKPYYDCGGGNIWMLTYTVPFFGYENATYHFKGTSGIDIDLRRVDIDQCPQRNIPGSTKPLNIFAGTDKCKQRTTMCEAIQGLGFRRGSYKCVCRKGYYFPDTTSQHKYFNGSLLEEEYEKLMLGKNSTYNIVNEYECLACAEGCDSCEDGSPCIAALNWPMRTSILALACVVIGLLPPAAWFTFRYQQVKVVRAASPALLRVIALGAFFIYCTNIVMYPNPNLYTCTARIWLREIGFSLTYGALMLKTWRISVIFRVRSAKAVKITDAALLKRLGCICGAIGTCLLVRTLVSPPDVVVGRTADDLKAFLCKTDWWDYTFTSMEVVFLAWGVRLCIMVRKAPSEFNESRFISMAIYNEFLLTCFLNVSMLFLQSPANPDLLYIIFFCHTQLTITLLLALIFGSKVYIVLRSGKSHQENIGMGAKSSGAKFNFRPQVRTFANPSSVTTSTVPMAATTSAETKLSDQEALEEIRQLGMQLQRIQEMAPPTGVAVMTISSLLDGLKTPTNMVMATAAVTHDLDEGGLGKKQFALSSQKPEALPLLSLNTEMQKYQQLQMPQNTATPSTTTNNNVAVLKAIPAKILPSTQDSVAKMKVTQSITDTGRWEEKAVNTEVVGHYVAKDNIKQQKEHQKDLREHIVCQSCYEKCKSQQHSKGSAANKCQILGSPQQEGSLSFKNIKLDCMCSQSDDLDQLAEHEQTQPQLRRITKRTAATNTPPSKARKHTELATLSQSRTVQNATNSVQLPGDRSRSGGNSQNPFSHITQQQQQQQQPKEQICDSCKTKFRRKAPANGKKLNAPEQPHRKLSRLNSKFKLIDIKGSKGSVVLTARAAAANNTTAKPQPQANKSYDCDEDNQYSTDDIIFYTTTDTSDNEDEDATDDPENNANREDDFSSFLSHSKSETRVPVKLKPHLATIELKCISLSLGNITANDSATATATTTETSSTTSTLQPDVLKIKNALSEPNAATTTETKSQQPATPIQTQKQAAPPATNDSNGSSNSKAKRPDKLVLNLNDRSKFTKEVSV